jgi:hypothetical protein
MFQLQDHEMIRKSAMFDTQGGSDTFPAVKGHQHQPLQIQQKFLAHCHGTVWFEIAVVPEPGQHKPVVQGPPEHVLAHVAPAGGGIGQFHISLLQRLAHVRHGQGHQARMAVGPAAFIGDPEGAQIPLFKHMHGDACSLGSRNGSGMDGAGIAVKHKVSDVSVGQHRGNGGGPVTGRTFVGDVTGGGRPKCAIAPVKAYAPHRRPSRREHFAQTVKVRPVRALQEQKGAGAVHAVSLR